MTYDSSFLIQSQMVKVEYLPVFREQMFIFQAERYQRLEELLNELMELHQNDIEVIKSQVSEQESISHYQNQESLRAFRENLNMLETKVNNLETLQVSVIIHNLQSTCFKKKLCHI